MACNIIRQRTPSAARHNHFMYPISVIRLGFCLGLVSAWGWFRLGVGFGLGLDSRQALSLHLHKAVLYGIDHKAGRILASALLEDVGTVLIHRTF